jgi:hypothetical protein
MAWPTPRPDLPPPPRYEAVVTLQHRGCWPLALGDLEAEGVHSVGQVGYALERDRVVVHVLELVEDG